MMPSIPTRRTLVGLIGLLLLSVRGHAAGDDYLHRIEEEAKRQAATPTTTPSPAPVVPGSGASPLTPAERLPLGLQQEAFEEILQREFMGTYAFYQRLSRADQRRVFEAYRRDNRVSAIRETTLELLDKTR